MTGFHKRKEQRRKKAKKELDQKVKNEIKRIRQQAKDDLKKKFKSFEPIKFPNLKDEDEEEEVVEDDSVIVSVQALGMDELAEKNNWIGQNRPQTEAPEESEGENEPEPEEVAGMSLKKKAVKTTETPEKDSRIGFDSKKVLDREMKKKTLKALKKSKTLKAKNRVKRSRDIKKSRREVHIRKKQQARKQNQK